MQVMNEIFLCFSHWLAPVLSFSAEEAWLSYALNQEKTSIHLRLFPEIPEQWSDKELNTKWLKIKEIRKTINEAIEIERLAKTIGSSLEAEILFYSPDVDLIKQLSHINFSEIAIVSRCTLINVQVPSNASMNHDINFGILVQQISAERCDRCWKKTEGVASFENEYGKVNLCARCLEAIA